MDRFERLYTAIFLIVVGVLMLVSNLYTLQLWWVKGTIGTVFIVVGVFAGYMYTKK
jgi:membrane-bound ClpP family serine protease